VTRLSLATALALGCLLGAVCPVQAQYSLRPGISTPPPRPTISPYINLLRGGDQALNYYGLVRPEFRALDTAAALQQQVDDNRAGLTGRSTTLPATGHSATFLNYRGYFLTMGVGGGQGTTRIGAGPGGGRR
jgi:hypothetical protein